MPIAPMFKYHDISEELKENIKEVKSWLKKSAKAVLPDDKILISYLNQIETTPLYCIDPFFSYLQKKIKFRWQRRCLVWQRHDHTSNWLRQIHWLMQTFRYTWRFWNLVLHRTIHLKIWWFLNLRMLEWWAIVRQR